MQGLVFNIIENVFAQLLKSVLYVFRVTVPGYQGNLAAAVSHTSSLPAWERFGVEFILTFVVVLTYFVSMERTKRWSSNAALNIGAAYAACTFVSVRVVIEKITEILYLWPLFILRCHI